MYTFYGLFVIYGFTQWVKVTRTESRRAGAQVPSSPARVGLTARHRTGARGHPSPPYPCPS